MAKKELGIKLEVVQPEEKELKVIGKARTKVPNLVVEAKKKVERKATTKKASVKKVTAKNEKAPAKKRITKSDKEIEK